MAGQQITEKKGKNVWNRIIPKILFQINQNRKSLIILPCLRSIFIAKKQKKKLSLFSTIVVSGKGLNKIYCLSEERSILTRLGFI